MASRLVFGVGTNDVPGKSRACHKDPFYVAWAGMLKRCYSEKYLERYPAYRGCTVASEWLSFSAFKAWMLTQDWQGMVLDKDLAVSGNRVYGPDTCLFIPDWLNAFLSSLTPACRDLPMGVSRKKGRYRARYSRQSNPVNLGHFATPEGAHAAYRAYRLNEIKTWIDRYCKTPHPCMKVIASLKRLHEAKQALVAALPAAA